MNDDPLAQAISEVRTSLGPPSHEPPPPLLLPPVPDEDRLRLNEFEKPHGDEHHRGFDPGAEADRAEAVSAGTANSDSVWVAIRSLKSLLDLVPKRPSATTRLSQCVILMRAEAERDQFADAIPDSPAGDSVWPIDYPRAELNRIIEPAKPLILGLLDRVDIEVGVRARLGRELKKSTAYLEPDNRGTIGAIIEPSGMTKEKERNNSKLDALAAFLHALHKQPYAAVRCAIGILSEISVPPDLLSVDMPTNRIIFRSTSYVASDHACLYVKMLLAAQGRFVSTGDVKAELEKKGLGSSRQLRSDRTFEKLPKALRDAIEVGRRGARLEVDRLLSHA